MKQFIYYIALIALFIVCMLAMAFIMTGVELLLNIKLGRILINFGFLLGIGVFVFSKPFVKSILNKYGINK